ncbi:uncharacterized protein LY89DRAFT_725998 [Mollisia scopiformis]|uniref:NACHT domain-containing protein n=1 Tax=Mollisia scopiformis TaxID=149040 RepID=A0A132B4J2_MOLSC|nr:uncharacterized protein LY89DRAFT_725998 [Mollisia scopiformis]KUJ07163.1 hypothetical protein LY89DRAFT_725998 [Mollisia scopiformis]
MDPLTSLDLAASIVQFTDLASKFVANEQRQSIAENGTFEKTELNDVNAIIGQLLIARAELPDWNDLMGDRDDEAEKTIMEMSVEYRTLATQIISEFEVLKGPSTSKWRAPKVVLPTDRIEDFNRRLATIRKNLDIHLMTIKNDLLPIQRSERFQELDSETQTIVRALIDESELKVPAPELRNQVIAVHHLLALKDRADLPVKRGGKQPTNANVLDDLRSGFVPEKRQQTEEEVREQVGNRLLEHLRFPVMSYRMEEIREAHTSTFEWIFDRAPPDDKWSSFSEWLSRGYGIYWVNGKEASGKSTLMKHIYSSPITHELLTEWALPHKLSTAAFFFWNSGTLMQRSQQGLLRSLLYTVLVQQRELIPVVFPHHWALLYSGISDRLIEDLPLQPGHPQEIQSAFRRLITQKIVPLKLFILVDGLDEYDGDHVEIIDLFHNITSSPNVKAVVSSRPLPAFMHAFQPFPGLCVNDLNGNDIRAFVSDRLEKDKNFQRLSEKEPKAAAALIHEIVDKSDGLFLWVVLVVRSLHSALRNRDDIAMLERRLQQMPQELELMYEHMLAGVDPIYMAAASEILQIVLASRSIRSSPTGSDDDAEPLTLIDLTLANDDPEDGISAEIRPWDEGELLYHCEEMAMRLRGRWHGFFHVQPQLNRKVDPFSKIQFSHRSAREYLCRPEVQEKFLACTKGSSFDPYLSLLKSAVHHLKILNNPRSRTLLWHFVTAALTCGHYFESDNDTNKIYDGLLTQLDMTMSHHHENMFKDSHGHWFEKTIVFKNMTKPDNGWEAKTHAALHWSNFHPTNPQPIEWESSFLSLVVQYGLSKFLSGRLTQSSKSMKSKKARPLLDYALNPPPGIDYNLITPAVVRVLFNHGANPNQKFQERSCWENALRWQYEQFVVSKGQIFEIQSQGEALAAVRVKICELLIEHGADTGISCTSGKRKLPVDVMLSETFKSWTLSDLDELLKLLAIQSA